MYRSALFLLLALALAGCTAAADISPSRSHTASVAAATSQRGSSGPYILGPGDRLRIKAYRDDQLSGEYEVGSAGFISIPLVGQVRAAGATVRQLERSVAAKMKGTIAKDPEISIEIAAYAPFYVFGEVKKAGQYPFRPGLTVADAIATAGGLTYRANENKIFIRRAGRRAEQVVTLDVPVRVFPGDNIRVTERIF